MCKHPHLILDGKRPHGAHRHTDHPSAWRRWFKRETTTLAKWFANENNTLKLCTAIALFAVALRIAELQDAGIVLPVFG